jgi:cell division protein FtsB
MKIKNMRCGIILYHLVAIMLSSYFIFAAIYGDFGVMKRVSIEAETRILTEELAVLEVEVDKFENLTRRLSDTYLDIDLLDEMARDMLGMARADEIIIR